MLYIIYKNSYKHSKFEKKICSIYSNGGFQHDDPGNRISGYEYNNISLDNKE
jgi:hypothetical protein